MIQNDTIIYYAVYQITKISWF